MKKYLSACALALVLLSPCGASAKGLSDACIGLFKDYTGGSGPKAFVTDKIGKVCHWSAAATLQDAEDGALKTCRDDKGRDCQIVAETASHLADAENDLGVYRLGTLMDTDLQAASPDDLKYLNVEHGGPELSAKPEEGKPDGRWSAMWVIEDTDVPVPGANGYTYVRLRNYWKPDQYLNIEHGSVESSPITSAAWSAMWKTVFVKNMNDTAEFENRWKPGQFLQADEQGQVSVGPDDPNSLADAWYVPPVDNPPGGKQPQAQTSVQQLPPGEYEDSYPR